MGGSVRLMGLARELVNLSGRVRKDGGQRGRQLRFYRDHVLRLRPALSGTRICALTAGST